MIQDKETLKRDEYIKKIDKRNLEATVEARRECKYREIMNKSQSKKEMILLQSCEKRTRKNNRD